MRRIRFAISVILLGFGAAADSAAAGEAEAWAALRAGLHVALMRQAASAIPQVFASTTAPRSAISAPRGARTPRRSARG